MKKKRRQNMPAENSHKTYPGSPIFNTQTTYVMRKQTIIFLATCLTVLLFGGCDVLDEKVLDESLTGSGQAEIVSGSIAPAYGQLAVTWLHTNYFGLRSEEHTSELQSRGHLVCRL